MLVIKLLFFLTFTYLKDIIYMAVIICFILAFILALLDLDDSAIFSCNKSSLFCIAP